MLLTAGQRARCDFELVAQLRKDLEKPSDPLLPPFAIWARQRSRQQVIAYRHVGKEFARLGDLDEAAADDGVRRVACDVPAVENNGAVPRPDQP